MQMHQHQQQQQQEEEEHDDEEMGVAETYADYWPSKCKYTIRFNEMERRERENKEKKKRESSRFKCFD